MGTYLNPFNKRFMESINSEIYVDKSELISITNKYINTEQKYICISRPRRFGKTMVANMLSAYYSRGINQMIYSKIHTCTIEKFNSGNKEVV